MNTQPLEPNDIDLLVLMAKYNPAINTALLAYLAKVKKCCEIIHS